MNHQDLCTLKHLFISHGTGDLVFQQNLKHPAKMPNNPLNPAMRTKAIVHTLCGYEIMNVVSDQNLHFDF